MSGYESYFPKSEPYPDQDEAMERIAEALEEARDVVFEGACGTGKTLSALVPSLEYARREHKTVVIATNVHQQMRQFVEEAREIKALEDVSVTVFKGKSSMCHVDVGYEECEALRENTWDLVELEQEREALRGAGEGAGTETTDADTERQLEMVDEAIEALEGNTCGHFEENVRGRNDGFFSWLHRDVRTPEEVFERAEEDGTCGYELLKEGMEDVDLVICNYNHLLDPEIRRFFFEWLDASPDDVIGVFDEAHNLEESARDHSGSELATETLERAENELADAEGDDRALVELLRDFRTSLAAAIRGELEFGDVEGGDVWNDVSIGGQDEGRDAVTERFLEEGTRSEDEVAELVSRGVKRATELDREYERAYKEGESDVRRECPALTCFAFLDDYLALADDPAFLPLGGAKREGGEIVGRVELYTCIPTEVTEPLLEGLHSGILMSATLRPFDVFEGVMGLEDPVELCYPLRFPESNRETLAVSLPPLFARNRDDPAVVDMVAGLIEDAVAHTPGNLLIYFPSQSEAARYHDAVDLDEALGGAGATGAGGGTDGGDREVRAMLDETGTSSDPILDALDRDDGVDRVVFTYLWGTLTEGVDFPDDRARGVMVVGVGYPYLGERRRAVQDAYDDRFGDGWRYGVETPTVRKTRQALGRVVRSPDDYGVRILADARYTRESRNSDYGVYDSFPEEEHREFVDVMPDKLRFALHNFWETTPMGSPTRPEPDR